MSLQNQTELIQTQAVEWQAAAAWAVVLLTLILIRATIAYVRKTGQLVAVGQNQLDELKEERAAGYRPLIHAVSAEIFGTPPAVTLPIKIYWGRTSHRRVAE